MYAGTPACPVSGSDDDASLYQPSDWLMACHEAGSSSGGEWRHRSSGGMSFHGVEGPDRAMGRAPGFWASPPFSESLSVLDKFLRRALTNQYDTCRMVMPVVALSWAFSSSVGYGCTEWDRNQSLSILVDLLLCLNPVLSGLSDLDRPSGPGCWDGGSMTIVALPAVPSAARVKTP